MAAGRIWLSAACAIAVAGCGASTAGSPPTPTSVPTTPVPSHSPASTPRPVSPTTPATPARATPTPSPTPSYSLTDPTSPWVVVNKLRPLSPKTYAPPDLVSVGSSGREMRRTAATALLAMFAAAQRDGLVITAASGYRSYTYQVGVYDRAVDRLGKAKADTVSARPGYSEHQTGWTMDVAGGGCVIEDCFGDTAEGRWVAANAYRFGFIVRYPDGAQAITGYQYEPWHVRYVGVLLATRMRSRRITTLERYFGLPSAPAYAGETAAAGESDEAP